MKVQVDINEKDLGFLCNAREVDELRKALKELYGLLWCEAVYDPFNEHTKKFAARCLPHIQAANKILEFSK